MNETISQKCHKNLGFPKTNTSITHKKPLKFFLDVVSGEKIFPNCWAQLKRKQQN